MKVSVSTKGLAIAGAILISSIVGTAIDAVPDTPSHVRVIEASGCPNMMSSYRVHLPCQGVPDSPRWVSRVAGTTVTGCAFAAFTGPENILLGCLAGLASNIPWGG